MLRVEQFPPGIAGKVLSGKIGTINLLICPRSFFKITYRHPCRSSGRSSITLRRQSFPGIAGSRDLGLRLHGCSAHPRSRGAGTRTEAMPADVAASMPICVVWEVGGPRVQFTFEF